MRCACYAAHYIVEPLAVTKRQHSGCGRCGGGLLWSEDPRVRYVADDWESLKEPLDERHVGPLPGVAPRGYEGEVYPLQQVVVTRYGVEYTQVTSTRIHITIRVENMQNT